MWAREGTELKLKNPNGVGVTYCGHTWGCEFKIKNKDGSNVFYCLDVYTPMTNMAVFMECCTEALYLSKGGKLNITQLSNNNEDAVQTELQKQQKKLRI